MEMNEGIRTKAIGAQAATISNNIIHRRLRYVPFVQNLITRTAIGFVLLVLSAALAGMIFNKGRIEILISIIALAWLPAIYLTDKYVHKYPQRYFTYLVASHLKAAIIMAFFLWIISSIIGTQAFSHDIVWTSYFFFTFADAIVSGFRRRDILCKQSADVMPCIKKDNITESKLSGSCNTDAVLSSIDTQAVLRQVRSCLDEPLVKFIEANLPNKQGDIGGVLILKDITSNEEDTKSTPVGFIAGCTRLNDVLRLNRFLMFCAERIPMGGYLVFSYLPLENLIRRWKRLYKGPLYWIIFTFHYIWYRAIPKIPKLAALYFSPAFSWLDTVHLSIAKKRNRALSKAEVWGRLSFCGIQVVAESKGDEDLYIIAQKIALPIQKKRHSYYPLVSLEKVGLDGHIVHLRKIRTMFPFSEFLQKRIFEDHGLSSTGKFEDDYRLTELGKFLRKYWLDELPQIFDWLRGDVKLVGMRATSPHFLSLYPEELYNLYIQIKPGLIPPIFSESTGGFEQIVKIELTYLQRYWEQPIRTDVRYFLQTFSDIVFRGIRSK